MLKKHIVIKFRQLNFTGIKDFLTALFVDRFETNCDKS